ncbi:MAG: glycine zipper 2TM domain-containing protein [Gammaproteobacteria bacterium]|nr:glycine zipper 2TM domain-containing protein [Gammaproteobacteria bacterium]
MKLFQSALVIALISLAPAVNADSKHSRYHDESQIQHFDFARVIRVEPIYRQVKNSNPVRECWQEPVQHTRSHKSAGGMVAGGLIGGIVGHQFGKGRGRKLATAVGTIIGAKIGHDAINGHVKSGHSQHVEYREHCEVQHRVSYEEVVDAYLVTYQYDGSRHKIEMPYHPGKRIKMRIQATPVI